MNFDSLERVESVTNYVCDASYACTPGRMARKEAVLGRPAHQIPKKFIDQLDEHSALERNWVGLASKLAYTYMYMLSKLYASKLAYRSLCQA